MKELPPIAAGCIWLGAMTVLFAVLMSCQAAPKTAFPDVTETTAIAFYSTRTADYLRPPWQRALLSLRPYTETVSSHGQARLDTERVTLAGHYFDNETPRVADWFPKAYAIGVSGGVEF